MDFEYNGPERREFRRLQVNFIATYRVDKPWQVLTKVGAKEFDAIMLDLGEGGAGILTHNEIPVATTLSIKFTLSNPYTFRDRQTRPISVIGDVCYVKLLKKSERRLGVNFTNIAKDDRIAIANLVKMVPYRTK